MADKNQDVQTRLLSEIWNEQAGHHFDLIILVLAAVNVIAALGVISTILYDARVLAKLRSFSTKPYASSFSSGSGRVIDIHPAEIIPLVVSIAITIQGIVYVVVQVLGLHELVAECVTIAQIVWPALWIVPYTMLVFGSETAVRSLQGKGFPCQTKRSLLLCSVAVLIAVLLTWIPSHTSPSKGICPATLVWWTKNYAKIGLAIGSGLLFTHILCAVVITSQLMRTANMNHNQRIAASRVVYYLIVSASLMTLTVPFFAQRTLLLDALRTAWVAEVSLNLFGLITFILHMSLRSNADRMAIQPLEGIRQDKKRLRLFGPSDLEMTMHITSPVLLKKDKDQYADDNYRLMTATRPNTPPSASFTGRNDSPSGDILNEIVAEYSRPVRSPPPVFHSPGIRRKGSNYSLFPTFRSAMLRNSMSTTFSQDEDAKSLQLPKPLPLFNHKREISEQSSATVQIGFRLSNMSDPHRPTPLSPTASSCCLPLQGASDSFTESPPVSPMSSRHGMARVISQDPIYLPLQPDPGSRVDISRLHVPSADWDEGRRRVSRTARISDRPMTMKALPRIPSIDGRLSSSDHPMPNRL
ncbi:MAG: hypothetical protein Q9168_007549 [Polycauliona sp. 1 TL-2023]